MRKRLTIQDMQRWASNKEGKCLSLEYVNYDTKLQWQCKNEHKWFATPDSINSQSWCPYCSRKIKHTIEDMCALAKRQEGACLSTEYKDVFTKLMWQCKEGHIWSVAPHHVLIGTWCPVCAGHLKLTIEDMHKMAKERGGKCLSKDYVSSQTKLIWQCVNGHIWEATPNGIQGGSWCNYCFGKISERLCREYIEGIFKEKFPIQKPRWLMGPKGRSLELDGYCEKLKLAFEYQGPQHYEDIPHFHKKRSLKDQQEYDKLKRELCEKNGVTLLEIPHVEDKEKMFSLIVAECKRKGMDITETPPFNLEEFKSYSPDNLRELQLLAEKNGGTLLSTQYINSQTNLLLRCKAGHEWKAIPNNIRRGAWCKICSIKRVADSQRGTIGEMKQLALSKGGMCLSEEYVNANSKLKWKCKNEHVWEATPRSIKSGSWCKTCYFEKPRTSKNIFKVCACCGIEFTVSPCKIKEGKGTCCSTKCANLHKTGRPLGRRKAILVKCLICDKETLQSPSRLADGRGKYCSKKCSIIAQKGRPSSKKKPKIELTCQMCKKSFFVNPAREGKAKFCSMKCLGLSKKGKPLSEETKRKLQIVNKGKAMPWLHTPNAIAKMASAKRGKPSWNKGKHWSDDWKKERSTKYLGGKDGLTTLQDFLKTRGEVLVSTEYKNNHSKVQVRCSSNHEYSNTFSHLQRGQGCPICHRIKIRVIRKSQVKVT